MERADGGNALLLKNAVVVGKAGGVDGLSGLGVIIEHPGDSADGQALVKNAENAGSVGSQVGGAVGDHFYALGGVAAGQLVVGIDLDDNAALALFLNQFLEVVGNLGVNLGIRAVYCHGKGNAVILCFAVSRGRGGGATGAAHRANIIARIRKNAIVFFIVLRPFCSFFVFYGVERFQHPTFYVGWLKDKL